MALRAPLGYLGGLEPLPQGTIQLKGAFHGRCMSCPGTSAVKALQDRYAPKGVCFGCGAANPRGLGIKSYRLSDEPYLKEGRGLTAIFQPQEHHRAFLGDIDGSMAGGAVNGGILGALVDCHGNWTAAVALMDTRGADELPSTVTAHFELNFYSPTPFGPPLRLTSRVTRLADPKVEVAVKIKVNGGLTASGRGLFVAVEPGHPAYHRWE